MLMLASYYKEMTGNAETEAVNALVGNGGANSLFDSEKYSVFLDAARLCPAFSETIVRRIFSVLDEKGFVTHGDREGRKADWLCLLTHLVDAGLLERRKQGRNVVFFFAGDVMKTCVDTS